MTREDIITFLEDEAAEGMLRRADIERCVGLIAELVLPFRFALGQRVRWACSKDIVVVDGRTYQERRHAAPVVQYRLEAAGHIVTSSAYEPDVEALEEDAPCG